jgi:hypothetical protein
MTEILGYDPGGNGGHGVAALFIGDLCEPLQIVTATCNTVSDATEWFAQFDQPVGIGIDTLTKWSTGKSGWRPADLWLRSQYPEVSLSVASPNSLRGSMAIGGMAVKSWFFSRYPEAVISETHPKVLYFALTHRKYDWEESSLDMADFLSARLAVKCRPRNDNEFDGAISCYAVFEHLRGNWRNNLHSLDAAECGEYLEPFGNSIYIWP